jgi:FKBP-type peptidyl-prolyl cis-trans isomerase
MKLLIYSLFAVILTAVVSCNGDEKNDDAKKAIEEPAAFTSNNEKYSYCWGMNLAMNRLMSIASFGLKDRLKLDDLEANFRSALLEKPMMSKEEAEAVFSPIFSNIQNKTQLTDAEVENFTRTLAILDAYSILATIEHFGITDVLDLKVFIDGYGDVLNARPTRASEDEANQIISNYFYQMAADRSARESAAFLEENAKKDSVQVTASGLQYKIIRLGKGKKPTATDRVKVNYRGMLVDGKLFDTSYDGDPIEFGLDRVIKGWTEGLQLMPEGSFFKFYIPSELAYGANPPSQNIPPNAALVFDVELLEVK